VRKIIAAMQVTADGFIEGPKGEIDWVESWSDSFDLLPQIDTCILGGGMYPGYEQYWLSILNNPDGVLPLTGMVATKDEVAYANFADKTPHVVLSKTLDNVAWRTTRIIRDVEDIRKLKQQPGKDMYVVGGATMVSSLMNLEMIDELRLTVHPIVLGGGKALFKDVKERQRLRLIEAKPLESSKVRLTYTTQ
jgi:dihydrofolate reductase